MLFSIIIPTYQNTEELKKCIQSLEKQSLKDFEVLICVDGKGKETMDWYHSSSFSIPVKIFHHPNFEHRGRSATRNLGMEHADGKYTVFLDSDMEADAEMLFEHLSILNDGNKISLGAVKYINGDQNIWVKYTAERGVGKFRHNEKVPFQYFIAPNTALITEWWKSLEGFDEKIRHYGGEDMELGYRLHKKFQPDFICNEKSIVRTTQLKTLDEALDQLKEYGSTGLKYIVEKYPELNHIYWIGRCESKKFSDRFFEFLTIGPFRSFARFCVRITPFFIQKALINYLVVSNIHAGFRSA